MEIENTNKLSWKENLSLDCNSEMIIKENGNLEVMANSTVDLDHRIKTLIGGDIEYLDYYVTIDPRVNLAVEIEVIARLSVQDDTSFSIAFKLNDYVDQVGIYLVFEAQDDGTLKESLKDALVQIHQNNMETVGCVIDDLKDFLSYRNIILPDSKDEQDENEKGGHDPKTGKDFYVSIYGSDYDVLSVIAEKHLNIDEDADNKRWWQAYFKFVANLEQPLIEEDDFYSEAIERGINKEFVARIAGDKELSERFYNTCVDHGLIIED